METITAAIVAARGSTVAVERKAGRLGAVKATVRQHIVAPLAGDPRQVTASKVVRCIAYLRSKPHITPTMITARTVADELGPWLEAGAPDRYAPSPQGPDMRPPKVSVSALMDSPQMRIWRQQEAEIAAACARTTAEQARACGVP